jgi:hypothetical protein
MSKTIHSGSQQVASHCNFCGMKFKLGDPRTTFALKRLHLKVCKSINTEDARCQSIDNLLKDNTAPKKSDVHKPILNASGYSLELPICQKKRSEEQYQRHSTILENISTDSGVIVAQNSEKNHTKT